MHKRTRSQTKSINERNKRVPRDMAIWKYLPRDARMIIYEYVFATWMREHKANLDKVMVQLYVITYHMKTFLDAHQVEYFHYEHRRPLKELRQGWWVRLSCYLQTTCFINEEHPYNHGDFPMKGTVFSSKGRKLKYISELK